MDTIVHKHDNEAYMICIYLFFMFLALFLKHTFVCCCFFRLKKHRTWPCEIQLNEDYCLGIVTTFDHLKKRKLSNVFYSYEEVNSLHILCSSIIWHVH